MTLAHQRWLMHVSRILTGVMSVWCNMNLWVYPSFMQFCYLALFALHFVQFFQFFLFLCWEFMQKDCCSVLAGFVRWFAAINQKCETSLASWSKISILHSIIFALSGDDHITCAIVQNWITEEIIEIQKKSWEQSKVKLPEFIEFSEIS